MTSEIDDQAREANPLAVVEDQDVAGHGAGANLPDAAARSHDALEPRRQGWPIAQATNAQAGPAADGDEDRGHDGWPQTSRARLDGSAAHRAGRPAPERGGALRTTRRKLAWKSLRAGSRARRGSASSPDRTTSARPSPC